MINMRRSNYSPSIRDCEHAGLLLDKGFETWGDDHNQKIAELQQAAADIECSTLYKQAYARWCDYQLANGGNSQVWFGQLENRLYIGLGEISPLEAGITLHRSYGVPFIPGSAVKGVLHHYAMEANVDEGIIALLFGEEADATDKDDSGTAAYVIFNDAWWVPEDRPALVPETITVHHPDYYSSKGEKPATDFDSPNPNPQIAVQGSFMFALEGDKSLVQYAIGLLKRTLSERGIGSKTSSGYGFFTEDIKQTKRFKSEAVKQFIDSASPDEKVRIIVDDTNLDDLPELLGKKRNKFANDVIGQEHWDLYLSLILAKFQKEIEVWGEEDKKSNKFAAYRVATGSLKITWK